MANKLLFWELSLTDYISEYHPERIQDTEFISVRAEEAGKEFERNSKEGKTVRQAKEAAEKVLYEGLKFSKFKLLEEIVENEMPEIRQEEKYTFIMQMMRVIEPIIQKYEPKDDFIGSEKEKEMYNMCVGRIYNYLEKNGLQ